MKKEISEQQLLKQLKIKDFRYLSKDTVMQFASSLQYMDPQVAMKVLEQFPNFVEVTKEGLHEYVEFAETVLASANDDHKMLLQMINAEHTQLIKMLDSENLTLDDKFKIMEKCSDLQERASRENKELRKYREKLLKRILIGFGIGLLSIAAILGVNSNVKNIDSNDDDDENEEV